MHLAARLIMLRSLPFFGGLPEDRLTRMAQEAVVTHYAPGALIASRDQAAEALLLVASGQVKLYRMGPDGREQTLYMLGQGEPFCLCSLVEAGEWPVFAAALTEVQVLTFPAAGLAAAARQDPEVLFDLLRLMCRRLKDAMAMIESLALRDLPGRVAVFLLHEAARLPAGGDTFVLTISQREVAKIVGATPEGLSRALRRLEQAGLVAVRGRDVELLDREGLALEAGGFSDGD